MRTRLRQANSNRRIGAMALKLATWDSSPGIRWGERLRTLLFGVRANPVDWGAKTPTKAHLPEAGRATYSKQAKNVPLDGQASRPSSDACCLRDGAYTSRLATLVQDALSSAVHHHGNSGVGLCLAEVRVQ